MVRSWSRLRPFLGHYRPLPTYPIVCKVFKIKALALDLCCNILILKTPFRKVLIPGD